MLLKTKIDNNVFKKKKRNLNKLPFNKSLQVQANKHTNSNKEANKPNIVRNVKD